MIASQPDAPPPCGPAPDRRARARPQRMRGLEVGIGRYRSGERRPRTASAYVAVSVHPERRCGEGAAAASSRCSAPTSPGQLAARHAGRPRQGARRAQLRGGRRAVARRPGGASPPSPSRRASRRRCSSRRRATRTRRATPLSKSGALSRPASASGVDYVKHRGRQPRRGGHRRQRRRRLRRRRSARARGSQERRRPDRASALPQRDRRASGRRHRDGLRRSRLVREGLSGVLGGGTTGGLLETLLTGQGDAIAATLIPEEDRLRIEAVGTATGSGHRRDPGQGRRERRDQDAPRRLRARARRQRRRRRSEAAAAAARLAGRPDRDRAQPRALAAGVEHRPEHRARRARLDGPRRALRPRLRRRTHRRRPVVESSDPARDATCRPAPADRARRASSSPACPAVGAAATRRASTRA